jgi:hypothetical protein
MYFPVYTESHAIKDKYNDYNTAIMARILTKYPWYSARDLIMCPAIFSNMKECNDERF